MESYVKQFPDGTLFVNCQSDSLDLADAVRGRVFTRLKIHGRPRNIEVLAEFRQLEMLSLQSCGLEDLELLKRFRSLRKLTYFSGSLKSLDLGFGHRSLRELTIERHRKLSDICDIAECQKLTELHLSHLPHLQRYVDLSRLQKLERLSLWEIPGWPTLTPLARLERLHYLNLSQTRVADGDWRPLLSLSKLKSVFRFHDAFGRAAANEFARLRPDITGLFGNRSL